MTIASRTIDTGLTGRPGVPSRCEAGGASTRPAATSGATAFVTAACDSPVWRAMSMRLMGLRVRIVSKTLDPASDAERMRVVRAAVSWSIGSFGSCRLS